MALRPNLANFNLADSRAVTPVIGTILILAITVVGMAAIMFYGAPTIDRLQGQNSQAAVIGEFENIQSQTLELSVPDAARLPTVNIPTGDFRLEAGTRIMVSAIHEDDLVTYPCAFHVQGVGDGVADSFELETTGCRTPKTNCVGLLASESCLQIYQVLGGNLVPQTVVLVGSTATVAGQDFDVGNWLIRLSDGASPPNVYAEAWLFDNDQLRWDLQTSGGDLEVFLHGGAVFSKVDGTYFLENRPPLQEDDFGTGIFGFWLRSLSASSYSSLSGGGTHQVFLGLTGNHGRIHVNDATQIRFDFDGELAEPWCNVLLQRNNVITGGSYTDAPGFTCNSGNVDGIRSVTYERTGATPFKLEFLHAQLRTSLIL